MAKNITDPLKYSEDGKTVIGLHNSQVNEITIREGVICVENYAFQKLSRIKSIKLPSTLETIGDKSFHFCTSLKKISFPTGLKSIGDCAFYNCKCIGKINLPDTIHKIGKFVFSDNSSLKEVTLSPNLTIIPSNAFANCSSLETVHIPDGIKVIDSNAFSNCTSLKRIELPASVKKIESWAFSGCYLLSEISMTGVCEIESSCFVNCTSLTEVTLSRDVTYHRDSFESWTKIHVEEDQEENELNTNFEESEGDIVDEQFTEDIDLLCSNNTSNIDYQEEDQSIDYYEQLHNLIGLDNVKREIDTMINFLRIQSKRKEFGLSVTNISYHYVFTGNAGTGKTTVARIIAGIYKELGIIKKGHLVETDRSGLIGEYVGHTAPKTNKIIDSALDGVLFIDEAYSLCSGGENDYGQEAIATLIKRMEDNRDRLVVILAGYPEEMRKFISSNSGLKSRFNKYIHFNDYTPIELKDILSLNLKNYDISLTKKQEELLINIFENESLLPEHATNGNARFARNLFDKIIEAQANRLAMESEIDKEKITSLEDSDLSIAYKNCVQMQ